MEMIDRCREITAAKRAELEKFDRIHQNEIDLALENSLAVECVGNRKERRRQAALQRKLERERV